MLVYSSDEPLRVCSSNEPYGNLWKLYLLSQYEKIGEHRDEGESVGWGEI